MGRIEKLTTEHTRSVTKSPGAGAIQMHYFPFYVPCCFWYNFVIAQRFTREVTRKYFALYFRKYFLCWNMFKIFIVCFSTFYSLG